MISIVIPVYNSSSFLHKTVEAIEQVRHLYWKNEKFELVLTDDGSSDESFEVIKKLAEKYPYILGIKLSRNFGHQIAVKTGLTYTSGDYIAIIDDDLQDHPSLLPSFFEYLDKGYDVAYGIRKKRKESLLKKTAYSLFYRFLDQISDTKIPLDSGDFCVMTSRVKNNMLKLQEQNPYLRGIRAWIGFKQIGVEYERDKRIEGESGYTLKKLLKIASDGIFSFSAIPLKVITLLGGIGLLLSVFYTIYILAKYLVSDVYVAGFTTLVILLSFFSSSILISLGIIGEYIYRIYDEVRRRPFSIIENIIQKKDNEDNE